MFFYKELSVSAQTALANITDVAFENHINNSISGLKGSFSSRNVAGQNYWYYQYLDAVLEKNIQIFLGKKNKTLDELIAKKQAANDSEQKKSIRSARILGARTISSKHFNLIKRFSDYGFFHAGALLIGSHAFMAYENMFGIKWQEGAYTSDVDFAHAGKSISLLLPSNLQINTYNAIESLKAGFIPQITTDGHLGARWQHPKEKDFFIDFLTPKTSDSNAPIFNSQLNVALQPLRFLEYSLKDVEQTILLSPTQALVVNVPNPARFAMHKILIQGERKNKDTIKAKKDLMQAHALVQYLKENRPNELVLAFDDITGQGKGWRKRFKAGAESLYRHYSFNIFDTIEYLKQKEGSTPIWKQ